MKFKPTFLICLILMTLCISCVSGINPENNTSENITPIVENNNLDNNIVPIVENNTLDDNTTPIVENNTLDDNTTPIVENNTLDDNTTPIVENNTLDENITNIVPSITITINGTDGEFIINNLQNVELELRNITIKNATDNRCIIKLQKGEGIYCEIQKDGSYFVRSLNNPRIIIIDDLNDDEIIYDYIKTPCLDLNRFNRICDLLYLERMIFSNWFWSWFW